MDKEVTLKAFLLWMKSNNICPVIPFFVIQSGRNGTIPHWTNGNELFDASELIDSYLKAQVKPERLSAMDEYAYQKVLEYARWFEDQGPPEYKQDDWMVKQNVESFFGKETI